MKTQKPRKENIEMKLKQFNAHLKNQAGALLTITNAFGKAGINILGLDLSPENDSYGTARILVKEVQKARQILARVHPETDIVDVIAIQLENKAGAMAAVLKWLYDAEMNIEFTYAMTSLNNGHATMICRFKDNDAAIEILKHNHANILDAKSFGMLM